MEAVKDCGDKHERVVNRIGDLEVKVRGIEETVASGWHIIRENKVGLEDVRKTHSILLKVESQIHSLSAKLDEFTKKKTLEDYIKESLVPVVIIGLFAALMRSGVI